MKDCGLVQGGPKWAVPLITDKDTVYVHTNIVQSKDIDGNPIVDLWDYNEIQYTYPEYFKLVTDQLSDVQLVVTDLYERSAT